MLIHRLRNWVAFFAIAAGASYPACSSKAVGVEECRQIEYARCEAAPNCPEQFNVTDVQQCKLFYRDHCLHGLPVSTAPNGTVVNQCVDAIQQLSTCAAKQGGAAALVADCPNTKSTDPKITKICKLLGSPEAITECSGFLTADSSSGGEAGAGAGGEDGTGGSTSDAQGGAGGSSGFGGLTL